MLKLRLIRAVWVPLQMPIHLNSNPWTKAFPEARKLVRANMHCKNITGLP